MRHASALGARHGVGTDEFDARGLSTAANQAFGAADVSDQRFRLQGRCDFFKKGHNCLNRGANHDKFAAYACLSRVIKDSIAPIGLRRLCARLRPTRPSVHPSAEAAFFQRERQRRPQKAGADYGDLLKHR